MFMERGAAIVIGWKPVSPSHDAARLPSGYELEVLLLLPIVGKASPP